MVKYVTFPLNNTEYKAEDMQLWHSTRSSGVFSAEGELETTFKSGMTVTISSGRAWIGFDKMKGIIFGNMESADLTVDTADGLLDRKDYVVIKYDIIENKTYLYIKKGELSNNAQPPTLERDINTAYELAISEIEIMHGTVALNQGFILDRRLDENLCGVMKDGVTSIPTAGLQTQWENWFVSETDKGEKDWNSWYGNNTALFGKQFTDWFNSLKDTLSGDVAGNLLNLVDINSSNTGDLSQIVEDNLVGAIQNDRSQLANIVTVDINKFSNLVVADDWSDAIQSASDSLTLGGTVLIPMGVYNVSKPIIIKTIGVTIKGLGYHSRIKAVGFVGSDIIKFQNTNPSYTINKNIIIENLVIDCNNQTCNGLNIVGAYDMCKLSNVEIWRTNGRYRGLMMTEDSSNAVSQTLLLENILAYHFDDTATVETMYFRKCQEVNMIGVKAFGSQVTTAQNCDCMVLDDCRGVTLTGCFIGFGKGLRIKANTRNSTGISLIGCTFEETYGNSILTEVTNGMIIDSLYMYGIRMQSSVVGVGKITLNSVQNALLFTNLLTVELISGNNNTIIANDSSKVTINTATKSTIIGFKNANMDYLVLPSKIQTQSIYNGTVEVIRTASSIAINSTGLLLSVNLVGTTSLKQVTIGPTDSGGVGYRALIIPNA